MTSPTAWDWIGFRMIEPAANTVARASIGPLYTKASPNAITVTPTAEDGAGALSRHAMASLNREQAV
jgi:hypothetical protein